jgi:FlaA1/EpsC-like NDP-sugar epimerase
MQTWSQIRLWLTSRKQSEKMIMIGIADLFLLVLGALIAYSLRVSDLTLPPRSSLPLYLAAPLLSVAFAALLSVYGAAVRGYSANVEKRIFVSQMLVLPVWIALILIVGATGFARSTVLIYGLIAPAIMISLRRFAAMSFALMDLNSKPRKERVPVIIYGAGREGQIVFESLSNHNQFKPVAFVDTDYTLVDRVVSGLKVYAIENLDKVVAKFSPREMVIARTQSNIANRRKLVDMALGFGLSVKTVPRLEDLVGGHISSSDIRPVKVEDLLGRDPVSPDIALMKKIAYEKCVLISGAGGSIGSELARQCLIYRPKKLVLLDNNEFALFQIHRELESKLNNDQNDASTVELVPILLDVKDETNLTEIMLDHKVEIVLHAAAYKHVRMVQDNIFSGIMNNVWGTIAIAQASDKTAVERFVLVSTDKAVRPTSIMGATKRLAELFIQAMASRKKSKTIFSMVRFGNVLGSTGSVVPLFKEQIENGGPILVTHPDVTRYFMLIPEAAQLVLQAGAMSKGGEVFVLDMGEPIKIVQLAETMVELAGLSLKNSETHEGDIEIQFTGLRDGEKLFEELLIGSNVSKTNNNRIFLSHEFCLTQAELDKKLEAIKKAAQAKDRNVAKILVLDLAHLGS